MSLLLIVLFGSGVFVLLAGFAALLFFLIKRDTENKGDMGINLSPTLCPKCATPLPMIRRPANMRQAIYGGNTCKNCGTEVDKWGSPV